MQPVGQGEIDLGGIHDMVPEERRVPRWLPEGSGSRQPENHRDSTADSSLRTLSGKLALERREERLIDGFGGGRRGRRRRNRASTRRRHRMLSHYGTDASCETIRTPVEAKPTADVTVGARNANGVGARAFATFASATSASAGR